jgi:hypothetical protein
MVETKDAPFNRAQRKVDLRQMLLFQALQLAELFPNMAGTAANEQHRVCSMACKMGPSLHVMCQIVAY